MQISNQPMAELLIPEKAIDGPGQGPVVNVSEMAAETLAFRLEIRRSMEHESLRVSIWGSADGQDWGSRPLIELPRKFYCGTYPGYLDLSSRPDIRYLKATWTAKRWGKGNPNPVFTIELHLEGVREPVGACA